MIEQELLSGDEIKQGCSAYIDHGGIGSYCRFKPTLRYNGKLYCTLHNPVRLKAISDKRSVEFVESMNRAEQSRKDNDERLRQEGRDEAEAKLKAMGYEQVWKECPDCEEGLVWVNHASEGYQQDPCPTCKGTGKITNRVKWDSEKVAEKLYKLSHPAPWYIWEQSQMKEYYRLQADQLKEILTGGE